MLACKLQIEGKRKEIVANVLHGNLYKIERSKVVLGQADKLKSVVDVQEQMVKVDD